MLLLALTALRTPAAHQDVAELVLRGDVPSALRIGTERFERSAVNADPVACASLGMLLGRCMLACDREEEAEDMFQRLARLYESISRPMVRWPGSLDRGMLMMHMNRIGGAVECFSVVADDPRSPADVRVEAMARVAVALHRRGEGYVAMQAQEAARRLSDTSAELRVANLIDCIALDLSVLHLLRTSDALADHALGSIYRENTGGQASPDVLRQQLNTSVVVFAQTMPLVAHRMRHLQGLLGSDSSNFAAAAQARQVLAWFQERRLTGFEVEARIESARMLIGRDALHAAGEVIAPLTFRELQVQRSRYSQELAYCLARLHQHQGRPLEALRLYRQRAAAFSGLVAEQPPRDRGGQRRCQNASAFALQAGLPIHH